MTPSTKQSIERLEQLKIELSIQIKKEKVTKLIILTENVLAHFNSLRKLNFKNFSISKD